MSLVAYSTSAVTLILCNMVVIFDYDDTIFHSREIHEYVSPMPRFS